MEREPSESNERGEDTSDIEATQAAERIVEVPQEKSMAEREYDAAYELVQALMDQGVDYLVAWSEIDESGKIQRDFRQQEAEEQDALNHTANDAIRQATHARKVAKIKKIYDPTKREQAMRELLATEQVQASRRGRRY